mmetsp:Transcript_34616/g.104472  ORF Transcript_34616/g.104472 Transcript_34616/m.104472 type:complete len:204 (+) Transcript_34616:211-822(+)
MPKSWFSIRLTEQCRWLAEMDRPKGTASIEVVKELPAMRGAACALSFNRWEASLRASVAAARCRLDAGSASDTLGADLQCVMVSPRLRCQSSRVVMDGRNLSASFAYLAFRTVCLFAAGGPCKSAHLAWKLPYDWEFSICASCVSNRCCAKAPSRGCASGCCRVLESRDRSSPANFRRRAPNKCAVCRPLWSTKCSCGRKSRK